jgi:hypothetical protein
MLRSHVETRGDGRLACRHIGNAVDDDHAVGAAPDHAIPAPGVTEPGHGAQDAIPNGEERGRDGLTLSSPDDSAVKGEFDIWPLGQIAEDRVSSNASRPKIAWVSTLLQHRLPELCVLMQRG